MRLDGQSDREAALVAGHAPACSNALPRGFIASLLRSGPAGHNRAGAVSVCNQQPAPPK